MSVAFASARKIWALLNGSERRDLVLLFAMMLVAMVLETFGVSLVLPALALFTDAEAGRTIPLVNSLFAAVGPKKETLVVAGMLLLTGAYLAKNAFLLLMVWRQTRFSHHLDAALAQRVFALYLAQPYTFHLQRNSAHLLNNIVEELTVFTIEGVGAGLVLITELLVVSALVALLLAVEPSGAIAAAVLVVVIGWAFQTVTREQTVKWGVSRQSQAQLSLTHLRQGLETVKEVILHGRQAEFVSRFATHNAKRADAAHRHEAVSLSVKLILEFLAIVMLTGVTYAMIARGRPVALILPTLGLFGAVAIRVIPSLNRILVSMQQVRYAMPAIDRLHADLTTLRETSTPRVRQGKRLDASIELAGVSFAYPDRPTPALHDVRLRVARGDSIGIVGSSGAGKSTLIDILLGLLTPGAGVVLLDGKNIREDLGGWQDQIGYVPQDVNLTDDSLRRNIAFGVPDDEIDDERVWRSLRSARLEDFVARLPAGLDTILGERGVRFSGGERQRVGIARALYHDPSVLVLDEATSALDTETEEQVMATVHELRHTMTIIIVTHRTSTLIHCDHIYQLRAGRLTEIVQPSIRP